ncbi:MAG: hypothetical protein V4487_04155 [Chlamydiota bacterium]
MSALPVKSQEFDVRPRLSLVKDGNLLGRNVDLISLDNPAALDAEIEKNKSLASNESKKEVLWIVAIAIAFIVAVAINVLVIIFAYPVLPILSPIISLVLFPSSSLLVLPPLFRLKASQQKMFTYENRYSELEECKETMSTNKFKLKEFAFGKDDLTLEQLLNAHRLFKRAEALGGSKNNLRTKDDALQSDINELRQEILGAVRV